MVRRGVADIRTEWGAIMEPLNRRSFLSASCLAVAGGLATRSAIADPSAGSGIKIAVKYHMVQEKVSVLEKFKLLKELGYDGVELEAPSSKLDRTEVLKARDESGLPIHGVVDSVHWKQTLSDPDPAVQEIGRNTLKLAIDDAKAYGASTVLLVPAVVNEKVSYDDAYKRSQANIRQVLPYAQEQGIKIAIENVWNGFLLSPLEFARYLDEFESPSIGAYFDIGNVVKFGWPEQWVRILGPRIIKLDVKEYSHKELFAPKLGEGDVRWAAVKQAITDIGYQGFATAEIKGGDKAYLKDVADRMNRLLRS